ncbi:uncharacterized protein LOC122444779 [Cervus canadensis]|uniref:uncharacterized protein LOC122444779 n=1 Tax=Cervus canadensis TaxID=1574408 RepID=UPI001C9E5B8F|nr:uncharacterized protein LOC122444779 [Cervus canadensis]
MNHGSWKSHSFLLGYCFLHSPSCRIPQLLLPAIFVRPAPAVTGVAIIPTRCARRPQFPEKLPGRTPCLSARWPHTARPPFRALGSLAFDCASPYSIRLQVAWSPGCPLPQLNSRIQCKCVGKRITVLKEISDLVTDQPRSQKSAPPWLCPWGARRWRTHGSRTGLWVAGGLLRLVLPQGHRGGGRLCAEGLSGLRVCCCGRRGQSPGYCDGRRAPSHGFRCGGPGPRGHWSREAALCATLSPLQQALWSRRPSHQDQGLSSGAASTIPTSSLRSRCAPSAAELQTEGERHKDRISGYHNANITHSHVLQPRPMKCRAPRGAVTDQTAEAMAVNLDNENYF